MGRDKLYCAATEGRDPDPPWICWVACVPPTASREPAAWRDPDAETARSELAPGDAKREVLDGKYEAEVRKPKVTKAESSGDVKVVPGMDVDVGLAFMAAIYFADAMLAMCIRLIDLVVYLSVLQVVQHESVQVPATLVPKRYHHPQQQHQHNDSVSLPYARCPLLPALRFLAHSALRMYSERQCALL